MLSQFAKMHGRRCIHRSAACLFPRGVRPTTIPNEDVEVEEGMKPRPPNPSHLEHSYIKNFGTIRFDSDNVTTVHGQLELSRDDINDNVSHADVVEQVSITRNALNPPKVEPFKNDDFLEEPQLNTKFSIKPNIITFSATTAKKAGRTTSKTDIKKEIVDAAATAKPPSQTNNDLNVIDDQFFGNLGNGCDQHSNSGLPHAVPPPAHHQRQSKPRRFGV